MTFCAAPIIDHPILLQTLTSLRHHKDIAIKGMLIRLMAIIEITNLILICTESERTDTLSKDY